MNKVKPSTDGFNEILLYTTPNGKVKVEIYLQNETIWLTQQKIADLFGVDRTVVTKHLKNIFETNELNPNSVSAKIAHTAADGKNYPTQFYNLDAIISVGYRVNSSQATAFRMWATERLKEYIIKGFTMDDKRLKNPNNLFGKDYFEELFDLIEPSGISYWVYGHHHTNTPAFLIGNTELITNQLGYVQRNEHGLFETDRVIEL
jgi:hypothetical protein